MSTFEGTNNVKDCLPHNAEETRAPLISPAPINESRTLFSGSARIVDVEARLGEFFNRETLLNILPGQADLD